MEKSRIEEIAMAVAMVEYYNEIIDNAKEEIRIKDKTIQKQYIQKNIKKLKKN